MTSDSFENEVLGLVPASPEEGFIRYDADGDILEFILHRDSFFAKRLNTWFTVYLRQGSEEPIGAVIKGFSKVLREIVAKIPGFEVELRRKNIRLETLLTAQMWAFRADQMPELGPLAMLRERAENSGLEAPVPVTC